MLNGEIMPNGMELGFLEHAEVPDYIKKEHIQAANACKVQSKAKGLVRLRKQLFDNDWLTTNPDCNEYTLKKMGIRTLNYLYGKKNWKNSDLPYNRNVEGLDDAKQPKKSLETSPLAFPKPFGEKFPQVEQRIQLSLQDNKLDFNDNDAVITRELLTKVEQGKWKLADVRKGKWKEDPEYERYMGKHMKVILGIPNLSNKPEGMVNIMRQFSPEKVVKTPQPVENPQPVAPAPNKVAPPPPPAQPAPAPALPQTGVDSLTESYLNGKLIKQLEPFLKKSLEEMMNSGSLQTNHAIALQMLSGCK